MAVTVELVQKDYVEKTGVTTGNEFIFSLKDGGIYALEGYVTSAGSATAAATMQQDAPTAFTSMVLDPDGAQSANFSTVFEGQKWAGISVASGVWTVVLKRIG